MKDKMSLIQNTNRNNISVKTDSAAELVRELSKLGIFRKKSKKRAKRLSASTSQDIKQDSDMVGYTRSLGAPQMRNILPIQQIVSGMTQQQIADIQERNNARFATLKAEVEQQRQEDLQPLNRIINIATERFRGAQQPGAGQRIDPFIQSTTIEEIPDINEGDQIFTQTLNEGGPSEAPIQSQTDAFPQDEEEEELLQIEAGEGAPLQPQPRIRGQRAKREIKARDDIAAQYNIGVVPPLNQTELPEMRQYYITLMLRVRPDEEVDERILNNKKKLFSTINKILDEEAAVVGSE
jgi:hypothetical protein